ncbi:MULTISPECIES: pantetheine-phosphate adenylyltransferase [Gallibacterium]|uniref:Phosphopantetheine adenylyltransferase n=1 Tax=Gallibacterium genomosp. 3 TaxID=505345 RepID=A0A1A7NNF7_9PAST|nr:MULTISPECIES: pantetheine-phosphate adenylyltransferase [Gallibacterium]MDA3979691.1 pantetheine-phosphate adenylyltransferase [Gallibacterium sp. AGMB14963]OBW91148.1 phosphopantetheine adenylyltransferase [Gallibacterium genomosp. 3]OBX04637.1 phosphopantetheine adenylyltransferase [Gallibacterium genomosp. 3]OBX09890.1 phosphopantetheine adenylyltransferase [Gallibacterium genomosp. 3]
MITMIYPGTFDPITNGHLDIICRAAKLFPKLIVAVAASPSKKPMFSLQQRLEMVKAATVELPNVEIIAFDGLLAHLILEKNVQGIIRGARTSSDFDYELQLAHLNRLLTNGVESLFFPPSEKWSYVSSTMVREILLHGGDIGKLVPERVFQYIAQCE